MAIGVAAVVTRSNVASLPALLEWALGPEARLRVDRQPGAAHRGDGPARSSGSGRGGPRCSGPPPGGRRCASGASTWRRRRVRWRPRWPNAASSIRPLRRSPPRGGTTAASPTKGCARSAGTDGWRPASRCSTPTPSSSTTRRGAWTRSSSATWTSSRSPTSGAARRFGTFRQRVRTFDFPPCFHCGGCHFTETNEEDCYSNPAPVCGECPWAQGIVLCP